MGQKKGGAPATQTTQPWDVQQPYLNEIFDEARANYYSSNPQYYPWETLAPQSADTLTGQSNFSNYAAGDAAELGRADTRAVTDILQGKYLTAESNPYLSSFTNAALRPLTQQFTESVLPNIRSDAMTTGGFGGSRQGIAEGLASDRFGRAIGETTSNIYNNAYNQGMQQFSRAIDQAPGAIAAGSLPAMMQMQSGELVDQRNQALINADIERWNFEQQLPENKLRDYLAMIQGNYGGTTTATSEVGGGNAGVGAVGGALAGAKLGSSVSPGWGTLIGAILGALGGSASAR
ncbi:MAG: hypothetical protein ACYC1K_03330 [Minisyncoccota bacterium]